MTASALLDHIVLAVPDLAAAVASIEGRLGIEVRAGGKHDGFGSHNAVFGLGDGRYFEAIAVDPDQDGGPLADAIRPYDEPELVGWAVRVEDHETVAATAQAQGLAVRSVPMSRRTPEGTTLTWRVVVVGGHPFGGAVPFFIDWLDTPHPTHRLPPDATLDLFEVAAPGVDRIQGLLDAFDVDVSLRSAPDVRLRARVAGPAGSLDLSGGGGGLMHTLL